MVVQHNLTAMNSNRMLGLTQKTQAKQTEKLSSGYRINRAADDAAGLSISEKMRKQIRGLTQASSNAQDGISAVQTAEGALAEVQDMLQRMNELAVKAANGTNSQNDRMYIQNEIDQLSTEIDRVAETTKFNETYLLKGDSAVAKGYTYAFKNFNGDVAGSATFNSDAGTGLSLSFTAGTNTKATQDSVNQLLKSFRDQGVSVSLISTYGTATTSAYAVSLTGALADTYSVVATDAENGAFDILDKAGNKLMSLTASGGTAPTVSTPGERDSISAVLTASEIKAQESSGATAAYYDKDGNKIPANALDSYVAYDTTGSAIEVKPDAPIAYDAVGNVKEIDVDDLQATQDKTAALALKLHVGADATTNNQISIDIESMSSRGLGVNFIKVDGTDDENALEAIDTIKEAIQKVSTQRSALGAVQNRLEHTIANLDNVVENTTSAESAIRDTDMASTMVKYSNNNILAQAGQAMLAQANQSNQGVLSLLG